MAISGRHALCAAGVLLVAACAPREQEFAGRLVDAATGAPVGGAEIVLWSRTWGLSDGEFVWDRQYTSHGTSASDGRFRVRHLGASEPRLCARAPGYDTASFDLMSTASERQLGLVRSRPVPPTVRSGLLLLGEAAGGGEIGWSFAEEAAVAPDRADLVLRSAPDLHRPLTLFAPGGLRKAPLTPHGGGVTDGEAPIGGYQAEITVAPNDAETLFVRTRDGERFARLDLSQGLALSLHPQGQKALQITYVFDPAGGRILRSDRLTPYCPF